MNNALPIVCGFLCIYPLLVFGIPAFFVGRYWGRIKIQSPVRIKQLSAQSGPGRNSWGPGRPSK